jgi:putative ABC transport system substrate-binding protein
LAERRRLGRLSRAQQADGMRRIGVLMNRTADDPQAQASVAAFVQGLQQLGWTDGRNLHIDTRWTAVTADPLGAGLVASMARPGGNATGFMAFEDSMSGKWLELLKQIAPGVTRAAVLGHPTLSSGRGQLVAIQAAAPLFGMEVSLVDVRDAGKIERAVTEFASSLNGGMIAGEPGDVDSS